MGNNSLQKRQLTSEALVQASNISKSLVIALERTNSEPRNLDNMVQDIADEFYYIPEKDIIEAIRKGGLGLYGRTFKFSTQEVCVWIRQYWKDKNSKIPL